MDMALLIKALMALAPVFLLLLLFDRLDVFELVEPPEMAALVLVGGLVAALSLFANDAAMGALGFDLRTYSRYGAPVIEECLKAAPVIVLFAVNRLGFKLDSAIAGFAVGAGFSVVENGWVLYLLQDSNLAAWVARGFGTAVMHGGATALFAVISHEFSEHQAEANATRYRFNPLLFIPGLAAAIVVHSTYNHFPDEPMVAMIAALVGIPLTLFFVFARSELATHRWVKSDHDLHVEILDDLRMGRFGDTSIGQDLAGYAEHARRGSKDEAYSLAMLSLELVLRAEEIMLARHEGKAPTYNRGEAEKFDALRSLRGRLSRDLIDVTYRCVGLSRNDLWEIARLEAQVKRAGR
jgi:protease PrsW